MERKFLFAPFMPFFDLLPSLPPLYPPPTFLHTHSRPLPHISAAPPAFVIPLSTGNLFRIPFTLSPPLPPIIPSLPFPHSSPPSTDTPPPLSPSSRPSLRSSRNVNSFSPHFSAFPRFFIHYSPFAIPTSLPTLFLYTSPTSPPRSACVCHPSLYSISFSDTIYPFSTFITPYNRCTPPSILPISILYPSPTLSLIPPLLTLFTECKFLFTPLSPFFALLPSLSPPYPPLTSSHIHLSHLPHSPRPP
ncbi:hypothetical protein DFH08DRAFT_984225 [Mycena albidolilacea]|uniref:Uncharacterized protein n=1 Tax=Mycena albidolilacea TaxID=1033008 RepID=A0AAD7AB28_9AGAR|nr:hypothetical protein DFH08DRAFT_984225 [Mycena albidolilacea]